MKASLHLFFCLLVPVFLGSCCVSRNGEDPIRYTGAVSDPATLPWFRAKADGLGNLTIKASTMTLAWGCKVKIEAGQRIPLIPDRDLRYLEYRAISQDQAGHSVWEISWDHRRYGSGKKQIRYAGRPVFAIYKNDFQLGMVPPEESEEDGE